MRLPRFIRRHTAVLEGEPLLTYAGRIGSIFDRPSAVAIAAAGSANKQMVTAGATGLLGCAVRESAGAATAWRIRDGSSAVAPIIAVLGAPANSVGSPVLPPQGVAVLSGAIFLENVSGSGEIVVYWG